MCSQQQFARINHAININGVRHQIRVVPQERGWRRAIQNSVSVDSARSTVTGMKAVFGFLNMPDHNILRQDAIESCFELLWRHSGIGFEVRHLTQSMNSSISPPCAGHFRIGFCDHG